MSLEHLCRVKPHGPNSGATPITMAARKMATTAPSSRVRTIRVMEMLPKYLALL